MTVAFHESEPRYRDVLDLFCHQLKVPLDFRLDMTVAFTIF